MHFNKKLLVSVLLVLMLVSISAVSAEENVTDDSSDVVTQSVEVNNDEVIASSDESDNGTGEYIIYVGQNTTEDGGDGSYENPFANFTLACNNVTGQEKVTLRIFSGTYRLGGVYNFNTTNLNIEGIEGPVIIKNLYDVRPEKGQSNAESFGSTNSNVNYSISNIIFDASDRVTVGTSTGTRQSWFFPFWGSANRGEYYNCSFINYTKSAPIRGTETNLIFTNCYFDITTSFFYDSSAVGRNKNDTFKNCVLVTSNAYPLGTIRLPTELLLDSIWFGQNNLPSYITPGRGYVADPSGLWVLDYVVPVSRYAIFSATENYLGNNTYEIVGKLTWNGTDDQDGMENFQPMTVKLRTTTGNITETAILKDGTFIARYTSNSSNNYVSATLDKEEIELEFTNIDMFLDAPAINVGDDQNITITLPQAMTTTVTLVVNNNTYNVEFDNVQTVTYTIEDILGEGNYTVEATINKDGVHAQNSTVLSVSKVTDYEFNVITPSDVVYGEIPVLEIELPDDATGNVTVLINNKTYSASANRTVSIPIDNLLVGDNDVVTTYSDFKYAEQTKNDIITVEKANAEIIAENAEATNEKLAGYTVTLKDAYGNAVANETLTVTIGEDTQKITTDANGIATIDKEFGPGIYNVNILLNSSNYNPVSKDVNISVVYDTKIGVIAIDGSVFEVTCILKDNDGNPIADANVSYALNGGEKVNATTDSEGLFKATVENNCVVDFIFEGADGYNPSNSTITLKNIRPTPKTTVIDVPSTMTKTAVDYNAGEKGTMFYFYLKDGDGKAVANKAIKIGIFDKIYTVKTDKNGRGGLQINIANANYYTYGISFLGDDDYKASFAVCSLQIVKKSVTITPAKTSYSFKTSAKTKTVTATLKSTNSYIPKGKQVTLTIAGKTFKANVGNKGQISFNIGSITAKGTYKVAIKFAGTNTYAAATSKTITIKIA